jgi:hypothetical protein
MVKRVLLCSSPSTALSPSFFSPPISDGGYSLLRRRLWGKSALNGLAPTPPTQRRSLIRTEPLLTQTNKAPCLHPPCPHPPCLHPLHPNLQSIHHLGKTLDTGSEAKKLLIRGPVKLPRNLNHRSNAPSKLSIDQLGRVIPAPAAHPPSMNMPIGHLTCPAT